jgi:hypothetical protein
MNHPEVRLTIMEAHLTILVYHFAGGAYVVGYGDSFEEDLRGLVAQYGTPVSIVPSSVWNGEVA